MKEGRLNYFPQRTTLSDNFYDGQLLKIGKFYTSVNVNIWSSLNNASTPFTMHGVHWRASSQEYSFYQSFEKGGEYFYLATTECGSFSFYQFPLSVPTAIWKVYLKLKVKLIFWSQVAPAAWSDRGGQVGLKPGQSCAAGAEYTFAGDPEKKGLSCMWFTDNTKIKGDATLKPELRTFAKVEAGAEKKCVGEPRWHGLNFQYLYFFCILFLLAAWISLNLKL